MKHKGLIIIEVEREEPFSEEQRLALVAALEFLFGERSSWGENGEAEGAPFGFRMRGLNMQIGEPGSDAEAVIVERMMKNRLEYPVTSHAPLRASDIPGLRAGQKVRQGQLAEIYGYRQSDPHHHEERLPAYPAEGLEFGDNGRNNLGANWNDPTPPTGLKYVTPELELPGMWENADFTGGQDEVRGPAPVPDAFEHERPKRETLPICGSAYKPGVECTVDASWPHEEHSNGQWHWRHPAPSGQPKRGGQFMRGAEDHEFDA